MTTSKTMATKLLPVGACFALLAAASPVRAEGPADEAAAVALFNQAKGLAASGDFAGACPKFVEVKRTLPTAGLSLNLGDCLEHTNKLASAWAEFMAAGRAAERTRDPDRQAEAARRAQAIEGKLSKLTVTVGQAEQLPGLMVKRDGSEIGEGQWGAPVPVDGGEHVVEVSAPGHRTWSTKVTVDPSGAIVTVAVPRLVPDPPPAQSATAPQDAPAAPSSWWTTQRIAGVTIASAGVVGLGLGAAFGAMALSKNAASFCSPTDTQTCTPAGNDARNSAFTLAHASTAGFVVGGAALVGGVVLIVTGSSAKAAPAAGSVQATPLWGPGVGGLAVRGTW